MTRRLATLLAAAIALGALLGCSKESPNQAALSRAEDHLADVRSGRLSMRVVASADDASGSAGSGFELVGPFAVGENEGSLPVADLRYTRITGSQRRELRFVSDGSQAFVEIDGQITRLTDEQVAEMRVREDGDTSEGGLGGLNLSEWIRDPQVSDGGIVDGQPTQRIAGPVDPAAALNDLVTLALRMGAAPEESPRLLEGQAAERVRAAVDSATATAVVGRDDHLLRHLDLTIVMKPGREADPDLKAALGGLSGARLSLVLDVAEVNHPVHVTAP